MKLYHKISVLLRLCRNFNLACETAESRRLELDLAHARGSCPSEIFFTIREKKLIAELKERAGFLMTPTERLILGEWPC